jgi:hypothetical protein
VSHPQAVLTPIGGLTLVRRIAHGRPAAHVAGAMGVSRATAYKWWHRYVQEGAAGLLDRRSRPLRSPRRTSASTTITEPIPVSVSPRPSHASTTCPGTTPRRCRLAFPLASTPSADTGFSDRPGTLTGVSAAASSYVDAASEPQSPGIGPMDSNTHGIAKVADVCDS